MHAEAENNMENDRAFPPAVSTNCCEHFFRPKLKIENRKVR